MRKNNEIGQATYLNKSNEQYIPFELLMYGSDCNEINKFIKNQTQNIYFIAEDNKP